MIIGITGKSGSGKSTLAKKYVEKGYIHVNIDDIAHEVIEENKYTIEAWLGTTDRKVIGQILFNNREMYNEYCSVIWNVMEKKIDRILKENEKVVLDFILLPHTKYWNSCYRILCKCSDTLRKERVLKRDNITEEYFNLRDSKSIEYNEEEMDEICLNT